MDKEKLYELINTKFTEILIAMDIKIDLSSTKLEKGLKKMDELIDEIIKDKK